MKLVIPISKHDRHLISDFLQAIEVFPIGGDHDLLIVAAKEVEQDAIELQKKIGHLFKSTDMVVIPDVMLGWPMSCNYFFQQACIHLRKDKNLDAFFWFELDTTPVSPNWLDAISKEYYADTTIALKDKRKPFMFLGAKERVYEGRNGELIPESVAGHRMAPIGVYSSTICFAPVLNSLSKTNRHWTHVIQWYVCKSLNVSKLIQNNWRTKNYRKEDKKIVCDSTANLAWDIHWNKPLNKSAVLVHGCKDGSLLNVLLNNKDKNMKIAKNISVEDAEDIADEIEDERDFDIEKQIRIYKQRLSNLKFFQKKPKESEEQE